MFFELDREGKGLRISHRVVGRVTLPPDTPPTQDSRKEEIIKKRKLKYILGMIWWTV